MTIVIATAIDSKGGELSFEYLPTANWNAFSVRRLTADQIEPKVQSASLAKAVSIWNSVIKRRSDTLKVTDVSERIRITLNTVRDAKASAVRAMPRPNF